jgi:heme/copper-type cytochrome/quinol oxidase subunit 2
MVKYFILDDHIKFDKGALRKYYNNKDYFYGIGFNEAKIKTEIPPRVMFDSNLTIYKDPKYPRLLCTDEILVLPSSTPLRMIVTATDVIHS